MTWDDVEDILYDGTEDEINAIVCPACGGKIKAEFFPETKNMEIFCSQCGVLIRSHGVHKIPNFAVNPSEVTA